MKSKFLIMILVLLGAQAISHFCPEINLGLMSTPLALVPFALGITILAGGFPGKAMVVCIVGLIRYKSLSG